MSGGDLRNLDDVLFLLERMSKIKRLPFAKDFARPLGIDLITFNALINACHRRSESAQPMRLLSRVQRVPIQTPSKPIYTLIARGFSAYARVSDRVRFGFVGAYVDHRDSA
ncbi:hypothetical protein NL676_012722 [Syzygium grande]|nr:hypothetical protein NL676_012722 [Syzygium grande]